MHESGVDSFYQSTTTLDCMLSGGQSKMSLHVHEARRDHEECYADPGCDAEENLFSASTLYVRRACSAERGGEPGCAVLEQDQEGEE